MSEAQSGHILYFPGVRPAPDEGDVRSEDAGAALTAASARPELGSHRASETFFRTAYNAQLTLHAMADNKARMMIQVNGLMLSAAVAAGSPVHELPLPNEASLLALAVCGAMSLLCAVLAARPQSKRGAMKLQRRAGTEGLSFSSQAPEAEVEHYVAAMKQLIAEPEAIYDNMSRNLYEMSRGLEWKHAWLHRSYTALAIGVLCGLAAAGFLPPAVSLLP